MAYTSNQLTSIAVSARTSNLNNTINSVTFSNTNLRAEATSVSVNVTGSANSVFSAQVTRSSDGRYYNFTTQTFSSVHTSQSRLKNQSPGSFSLAIPAAASGDVYTVIIMAEPHYGTRLTVGNGIRYATTATQVGNAKITFTASGTGITNTALGDSTGSIVDRFTSAGNPTVVIDELQLTVPDAASDNGFFITTTEIDLNNGTWDSGALYWQTGNYVANGAGTDATALILDSVDDLFVGMQVGVIAGTAQSALRTITAINTTTKTLTLDGNATWLDDGVILFRAYGLRLIKQVIGIGFSLVNPTVRLGQTTTSIDDELTSNKTGSADINVNGTLGIGVGATVRIRGLEKSEDEGACTVASVDSSSNGGGVTGGSMVLSNYKLKASAAKPVRSKTKIYIDGSSNKVFLSATIGVYKYPLAAQIIYVDINKILTKGTAS